MADFTVEGIIDVDASRGIRGVRKFKRELTGLLAELKAVDKEIKNLDGQDVKIRVDADLKAIRELRAQLAAIRDETVEIKIKTDTDVGQLADDMERIRKMLGAIGRAQIGIDADTSDAMSEVIKFLAWVDGLTASIRIDADTSTARRDVEAFVRWANSQRVNIRVDADRRGLDGFRDSAMGANRGIGMGGAGGGGLIAGIIALIALMGPLAGAAGAAVGAMAGFGAVAGTVFGALGVFAAPAIGDITESIKLFNSALTETDPDKLAEINDKIAEMKKNDPIMYKVASRAMELKDRFLELSKSIRPQVLGSFNNILGVANTLMESTIGIAQQAAGAVETMTARMDAGLKGEEWQGYFDYIESIAADFVEGFMQTIGNFMTGFANLIPALDPLFKQWGNGFLGMSEDFRKWSQGLENNQSFQAFLDYMIEMGPKVMDAVVGLISVIAGIITDLAPLGALILEQITNFTDWYNALRDTNPELVETATQVAAIGLALGALAGPLMSLLGPVVTGLAGIIGMVGGVTAGVGLAVIAVGALLGGMVFLNTDTKEFKELSEKVGDVWEDLKDIFAATWEKLQKLWELFKDSGAIEQVQAAFTDLFDAFQKMAPILEPIAVVLGGALLGAVVALAYGFRAWAWWINVLAGMFQPMIDGIVGAFQWLYDVLIGHSIIPDLMNGIIAWFGKLPGAVLGILTGFITSVIGFFANLAIQVTAKIASMVSSAIAKFGEFIASGIAKFTELKNRLSELAGNIKTAIVTKIQELVTGFVGKITELKDKVMEKFGSLKDSVTDFFSGAGDWLLDAGADIIGGLIDGISSGFDKVKGLLGDLTDMLPDWKGPKSRDKVLLRDNGRMIMDSLSGGLATGFGPVKDQLQGYTDQLSDVKHYGGRGRNTMDSNAEYFAAQHQQSSDPDRVNHWTPPKRGGRGSGNVTNTYHITVKVPVSANKAAVGKEIVECIEAYERQGGRKKRTTAAQPASL